MKTKLILSLSLLITRSRCIESVRPESTNCLTGVIIGTGCTDEGCLIKVTDLKDKEIEVDSVIIDNKNISTL